MIVVTEVPEVPEVLVVPGPVVAAVVESVDMLAFSLEVAAAAADVVDP